MKKILLLLTSAFVISSAQAAAPSVEWPTLNAYDIMIPVKDNGRLVSLMELSTMRVKDFEALSGRKLSFFDRIGFKIGQKKLRSKINDDGTVNNKALRKHAAKAAKGDPDFHAGGFFLGLLLNIYAIPIVYLMKDENRKRRIKWMWIGLGIVTVFLFLILLTLAGGRFR